MHKLSPMFKMLCLALALAPLPGAAQESYQTPQTVQEIREALVIVRFNQRNVYFEKSLYNAVSAAVAAKPNVGFDIELKPAQNGGGNTENLQRVALALRNMGIPDQQIQAYSGGATAERFDQVYVYVR